MLHAYLWETVWKLALACGDRTPKHRINGGTDMAWHERHARCSAVSRPVGDKGWWSSLAMDQKQVL